MSLVLLAVDETDESIEAARTARDLFGPEATYLAVTVAERPPAWAAAPVGWGAVYPYPYIDAYPVIGAEAVPNELDEVIDEAQATAHEVAAKAGIAAAAEGEIGDPVTAILAAADKHAADVIVVGSGDKSWWRRLIEGSVTKDLVRESRRPVLVVPYGHANE
jgi:nucleotide-binding universal stress UspA family protein